MIRQGQGRHTANKIAALEAFFTQNISVVKRGIRSSRYFHFDLNAGCGDNEHAGCIGSPLAFRSAAIRAGMPEALCFCCELDRVAAKQLNARTHDDEYTFVTVGRNQDFVEEIPDIIRQHGVEPRLAFGSILVDPNDQRRDAIPYDGLRLLAVECPKIDVIFHFPQLAMKRILAGVCKGTLPDSCAIDCFDVDDLPTIIGKKHLWIKQTSDLGNFAIVVGRNTANVNDDRRTGLARWESDLGLFYRERCRMKVDDAARRHQERMDVRNKQMFLF